MDKIHHSAFWITRASQQIPQQHPYARTTVFLSLSFLFFFPGPDVSLQSSLLHELAKCRDPISGLSLSHRSGVCPCRGLCVYRGDLGAGWRTFPSVSPPHTHAHAHTSYVGGGVSTHWAPLAAVLAWGAYRSLKKDGTLGAVTPLAFFLIS